MVINGISKLKFTDCVFSSEEFLSYEMRGFRSHIESEKLRGLIYKSKWRRQSRESKVLVSIPVYMSI